MTRTKSLRYNAAAHEPLLIQSGKEFFDNCKGNRKKDYFKNNNPIVLELACGRGEYTVGLSQIYPDKNFIGVDIKGERMMMGIKSYKSQVVNYKLDHAGANSTPQTYNSALPNIAFLRTIIHHIDQFFAAGEVDEIWIVHPDPRPKGHDAKRRITSPRFLAMYANILKPGGLLRLKTDDDGLFEYSIEELSGYGGFDQLDTTWDLASSPLAVDHHGIETHYGQIFVAEGRTIKYGVWKKQE